MSQKLVLYLA